MNKNPNQPVPFRFLGGTRNPLIKRACFLPLAVLIGYPLSLAADETAESSVIPKKPVVFAPTTLKAFDHSGKAVIHKTLQDGSRSAEHRGTHGHVMVARVAANGSIETFCTTGESAASAWLAGEEVARPAQGHVPAVEK